MGMHTNVLFLVTLVCGTILIVVLSIIISSGSAKPKQVPNVMYFAMFLVDENGEEQSLGSVAAERKSCSFHLNVNNTRSSIMAMQDLNYRYSFVLYDENAQTTAPLKTLDAIAQLTSIKPTPGTAFNQTSAIGEFARQYTERDKLVYYFPCRYNYSEDKDKEQFLEVIKKFGLHETIMLVSNTLPAESVANAFNWSLSNIVGEGMNIVERVQSFGSSTASTTQLASPSSTYSTTTTTSANNISAPFTSVMIIITITVDDATVTAITKAKATRTSVGGRSTSTTKTTSGAKRTMKSTTYQPVNPTTEATATSVVGSTTTISTTTRVSVYTTTPVKFSTMDSTSTVKSTTKMDPTTKSTARIINGSSTTFIMPTNTEKSTSESNRTTKSTASSSARTDTEVMETSTSALSTTSRGPINSSIHCLFVGDLRNFATSHNAYAKQRDFIGEISKRVFQASPNASAGLWVYGFTNFIREPAKILERMRVNFESFRKDLMELMEIVNHLDKRAIDSKGAARAINNVNYTGKANCITFMAGVRGSYDMSMLNPKNLDEPKRVVLVSLRGVNLTMMVDKQKGAAISVSRNYTMDDVSNVVNLILSVFH